jgi:predicted transcriptional regulator
MPLRMYDAVAIVAAKLRSRDISQNQFAELVDVSSATMSRWMTGDATPTPQQLDLLKSTMKAIDDLFSQLYPVRPDLSSIENARTILKLVREKKLWSVVKEVGYEEAYNLTKEEMESAKLNFEGGVKALYEASLRITETACK